MPESEPLSGSRYIRDPAPHGSYREGRARRSPGQLSVDKGNICMGDTNSEPAGARRGCRVETVLNEHKDP